MSQDTETSPSDVARQVRELLAGRHVCPFCGGQRARADIPCPRCTMEDTPATRQATVARLGPWFVLQSRNPSAPGMRWATLIALVRRGQVGPRSVVRGPVTSQLWTFAAKVRGLSREMGVCYDCGQAIDKLATRCPSCGQSQEPPMNPDALLETLDDATPRAPVMREVAGGDTPTTTLPTSDPEMQLQLVAPSGIPARRDLRNRTAAPADPTGDDAILTARELATAFQLGVGPQATRRRYRRRLVRSALALLVLALTAAAVWGYNDPRVRSQASGYLERAVAWFKEAAKPAPAGLEDDQPLSAVANPVGASTEAPSSDDRRPTPAIVERSSDPEPTPRPSPIPAPTLQPGSTPQPDSTPPPGSTPPNGRFPAVAAIDPTLANLPPIEQSRALYRRAIDAMAREDFALALQLLEAIETLPRNVHPGDLPSRLALVRQKLAGR